MSLSSEPVGPIPEVTARVARAAFPKGNRYIQLRDLLGAIYDNASFQSLFARRGRPAEAPWRLALVTVMQFAEGLSDRQAAEAVRSRIDWKYALGLELTDPGFDYSVLCEFRGRLVEGTVEQLLLDALLAVGNEHGLLKARGRQRTDSTHVLGALRLLSRLELVAETLRASLNALAVAAPEWLRATAPPAWFDRYGRRIEDYRLPKGKDARQAFAITVGVDGFELLASLDDATAPSELRDLPAIQRLRHIWSQQYVANDDGVRWCKPQELPSASEQLTSPYEPDARFATKRGMDWIGYKVQLTETCDDDQPHLLTQVTTTIAPATDFAQLAVIQADLARRDLLPAEQLADAGYVRGSNLVASRQEYQIDLVGPASDDHQWQAKAGDGFDVAHFQIDWEAHQVTCPQGHQSARWTPMQTARNRAMIHVDFSPSDCTPCPVRASCTRAKTLPRGLTLQPQAEHAAIQAARLRQTTAEYAERYAQRSGIEGTVSQGVRAFGLRQARYRGLAKTHLQQVAIATAINLQRIVDWMNAAPSAPTRCSHFTALNPAA